jgi:hypothetical protein
LWFFHIVLETSDFFGLFPIAFYLAFPLAFAFLLILGLFGTPTGELQGLLGSL